VETSRKSALDVAKNALNKGNVRFLGVVHEETHLLDRIVKAQV
jgi:predicted aldo/keto reductase-like oxidoreductase